MRQRIQTSLASCRSQQLPEREPQSRTALNPNPCCFVAPLVVFAGMASFDAGYGSTHMARMIGQKKAREMWFLCKFYGAKEALDMGLVNKVVPLEDLEQVKQMNGAGDWSMSSPISWASLNSLKLNGSNSLGATERRPMYFFGQLSGRRLRIGCQRTCVDPR